MVPLTSFQTQVLFVVVLLATLNYFYFKPNSTEHQNKLTKQKVFCIGMFKTGTTSVAEALSILGYKTSGGFVDELGPHYNSEEYLSLDTDKFKTYTSQIKHYADTFDAFADSPWLYMYKELDAWYPGSKFILTVRDPHNVASSDTKMIKAFNRPQVDKNLIINRYITHTNNVLDYFKSRPGDLLVMDIKLGWGPLCEFLDRGIPSVEFPHKNKKGAYFK